MWPSGRIPLTSLTWPHMKGPHVWIATLCSIQNPKQAFLCAKQRQVVDHHIQRLVTQSGLCVVSGEWNQHVEALQSKNRLATEWCEREIRILQWTLCWHTPHGLYTLWSRSLGHWVPNFLLLTTPNLQLSNKFSSNCPERQTTGTA